MATGQGGWASTPFALGNASGGSSFQRNLLMRIGAPEDQGGRFDDLWAYHEDQPGYRTRIQSASFGHRGSPTMYAGTGRVSMSGFGGGNTPSNPGAHNWATFADNTNRVAGILKGALKTGINLGLDRFQGIDTGAMNAAEYRVHMANRFKSPTYRNVVLTSRAQNRVQKLQQARQQASQTQAQQSQLAANTQAYNATFNPDLDYTFQYEKQINAQNASTGGTTRRRANPATIGIPKAAKDRIWSDIDAAWKQVNTPPNK